MSTKIRHVAIHTDNHFRMANFYKTLFGMKKITAGMTDENGNYDKERGHLSDGTIGLALLQRQPGALAGLDHFGFKVENLEAAKKDIENLSNTAPGSNARKIAIGRDGETRQKNLQGCKLCKHALADPDGVLLDLTD